MTSLHLGAPRLDGHLCNLANQHRYKPRAVKETDVAILASLTGLTAYDATYVWLAGWLEAELVTLDRRLASVQGMPAEYSG